MRALGWILLIVGIALAGLGGARNGHALSAVFAHKAPADLVAGAVGALDGAYQAHSEALNALRAARASGDAEAISAAQDVVDATQAAIASARDDLEALRQAGVYDNPVAAALPQLQAAVPDSPPPGERLLDWLRAGGPWWGGGVLLVAIGAFLARRAQRQASTDPARGGGGADFAGTVRQVLDVIQELQDQIADLPMDAPSVQVREELDRVQDELLTPLVDARAQLIARHGTQHFAVYFGAFSAGERNLNRTWSALTDGHSVVARESLERARVELEQALRAWDEVEGELSR